MGFRRCGLAEASQTKAWHRVLSALCYVLCFGQQVSQRGKHPTAPLPSSFVSSKLCTECLGPSINTQPEPFARYLPCLREVSGRVGVGVVATPQLHAICKSTMLNKFCQDLQEARGMPCPYSRPSWIYQHCLCGSCYHCWHSYFLLLQDRGLAILALTMTRRPAVTINGILIHMFPCLPLSFNPERPNLALVLRVRLGRESVLA